MNRRYPDEDTLLNVTEAADFLRASRAKLYRLVRTRQLVAHKVGATYVFYLRDLNAYVLGKTSSQREPDDADGRAS